MILKFMRRWCCFQVRTRLHVWALQRSPAAVLSRATKNPCLKAQNRIACHQQ